MAVARTCINHTVRFDVRNLLRAAIRSRPGDAAGDGVVTAFERRFADHLGVGTCIAFPFARSAFLATLQAMDLPPGSEVILPPITIQPMVDAVRSVGCQPVVVDIDPGTLLFDQAQLVEHLNERTRVVMLTYLFGIASDPTPIIEAARAVGARIVEDFSHNLGATVDGRQAGAFGDVGIYSSSATKTLDTYGGGLAVTDDADLAARLRRAQTQLRVTPRSRLLAKVSGTLVWNLTSSHAAWTVATFPLVRWLRRRHPGVEQTISGARKPQSAPTGPSDPWFERFTAQQASVGLELLPGVAATDRVRVANAEQIRATLRYLGVPVPTGSDGGHHVHWQCVAYIEDVERVQRGLAADGFDTAGTNLRLVCECEPSSCHHPVARAVKQHALYLPCHPGVRAGALHRLTRSLARLRPMASVTLGTATGTNPTGPDGDRLD
ncbi:MAG: DegT/DnrJ/EryC1/StrS family aminotransferase [Acidobacteria bacterium]|nr:DegT/DnrJ/EryC1/StrS family aminotransferase [Acidobacteriota bacterium]